jgi:hypothetical protein
MRSAPKARATANPVDEWGMYDPAKAGLEALFLKLGLTAEPAVNPRRRRRGRRTRRLTDDVEGVCSAIDEARRRAAAMVLPPASPVTAASPAAEPAAGAIAPPASPAGSAATDAALSAEATGSDSLAKPARKRGGRAAAGATRTPRTRPADAVTPAPVAAAPTETVTIARKQTKRTRKGSVAPATDAGATTAAAPLAVAAAPRPAPRFRRPAPLAAWARNAKDVVYAPTAPPRLHADVRVSWRAMLAIPAEVAGVEYARGARIRRIVIEERE